VIVLRLAFMLALLTIAVAGVMYFTTRQRRYLTFLWSVLRYTLYLLAGVAVFFILERLILVA
jgi:hypothetical protein